MRLFRFITLLFLSYPLFGQNTAPETGIKFTAIEKQGKIPMLFAEKEGVLFSFANKGDSLLENRSLGLTIRIPKGFRTNILESWIKKEIQSAKFDIAQFTLIKTIYFDFNSALIRNDASAELDKMAELMTTYPFAKVEAIVHTDSRGSSHYNKLLASRRGNSIREYLKTTGIALDLFAITVSGEEALTEDCLDQTDCDEIIHQLNRRAEFNFDPRTQ
ncbi:MAG: OmpA family protein [Cyclobacteriaceae bacterium]|nr:OmpA family protein [Cyclobacteriaceae bacterium]